MKAKIIFLSMLAMAASITFTSCNDDEEDPKDVTLNIDKPTLTFDADASEAQIVTITTDADTWSFENDNAWIVAIKDGDNLSISVNENTGDPRSATITVTASTTKSQKITVKQKDAQGNEPDDDKVKYSVKVEVDDNVEASLVSATVTFTNVSSGDVVTTEDNTDGVFSAYLAEGSYNISVSGNVAFVVDGYDMEANVTEERQNVSVSSTSNTLDILLSVDIPTSTFVIEEVYYTGSMSDAGSIYSYDKYFIITNNTAYPLYADGLAITESAFLTCNKYDYTPDIMSTHFSVTAVYVIPGSGTDVLVEPGASLIICDQAIDHRDACSSSFDLTGADFEWFDESSNPNIQDIDNPDVPNLDRFYTSSLTLWTPHTNGYKSYALAKIDPAMTAEQYVNDYLYDYEYIFEFNGTEYPMSGSACKIPNEWILDAVNFSTKEEFQWIVTDPSLDSGWNYCGEYLSDPNRLGMSMQRKVLTTTADGRRILQDTNNTTNDFAAGTASLRTDVRR